MANQPTPLLQGINSPVALRDVSRAQDSYVRDLVLSLVAATVEERRVPAATSILIKDVIGGVTLQLDENSPLVVNEGDFINIAFSRIRITSAIPQTIRLRISNGEVGSSKTDITATVSQPNTIEVNTFEGVAAIDAIAATKISVASSSPRNVLVRNTDLVNSIRVGPAGITTAVGFPLAPGEAVALETSADLWGIAIAGTAEVNVLIGLDV